MPKTLDQTTAIRLLERHGWSKKRGGNPQTGRTKMIEGTIRNMEVTAKIHREDGSYWAEVPELPGCFASGDSFDELFDSLREGVLLYLEDDDPETSSLEIRAAVLSDGIST